MSPVTRPLSLAPVLFRIASWPIGAVDTLRSAAFTAEVDCALMQEETIRARAEEFSALIHAQVPRMDPGERRIALRVRRALHRSAEPANPNDVKALANHPAIGAALVADDAGRRCLQDQLHRLDSAYAAALDAELAELRMIAAGVAFRRALAVASPGTSDALEELLRDRTKPEAWRLRTTLLNFVMRAVGRATPNGLWSGVAMESHHDGDGAISVRNIPGALFVKPDLNAFFELFDLAASPPHYRRAARLRWNPTMTRLHDGDYAWAHYACDGWRYSRTPDDDDIAHLREVFAPPERAEFDELQARSGLADEALHRLYISGLLCAACDEGGVYEDAWSALKALIDCLSAADRPLWEKAICDLRRICSVLAEAVPNPDVAQVRRGISESRAVVNALRARYDAPPLPSDRSVLIFDQLAPFAIAISDGLRQQISWSLRRCWNFDRGGLGEVLARNARMSQAANTDADVALALAGISIERTSVASAIPATAPQIPATSGSWEEAANGIHDADLSECFGNRIAAWTADLENSWTESIHNIAISQPHEDSPMPFGSALLVPAFTSRGLALRVGSVTPDSAAFYGRFHHLFASRGDSRFRNWIAQSKAIAEAEGVDLADVAIRGRHDRNAALRPRLGNRMLDAFSGQLTDLTAEIDATQGVRLRDHEGRRVFPVLHSAVETSNADPWGRWFAEVEANTGRTSLLAPAPPLARELDQWKHCPRLTLNETTVIGPERWWCPRDTTEQLRRTEAFDRYLSWRRWVRQAGIPARVYTRYGTAGTETLLLADSVLAIEVLGHALSQMDSPLRLQEMFFGESGFWLEDENGHKYLAEMAVAWRADREFWRCS